MNRTYAAVAFFILLSAGCASAPLFTVLTSPSGADIYIDGEKVGKTPATIKVKFAENSQMVLEKKVLVVKLPGYKEQKEVISSHEGATALKFQLVPDRVESAPSPTDVVSIPSATSEQENKTGIKADVVSEPSVTTGQASPAVVKADVVSQQLSSTGP